MLVFGTADDKDRDEQTMLREGTWKRRKAAPLLMRRMGEPFRVYTAIGVSDPGEAGDMLAFDPAIGCWWVVRAEDAEQRYEDAEPTDEMDLP